MSETPITSPDITITPMEQRRVGGFDNFRTVASVCGDQACIVFAGDESRAVQWRNESGRVMDLWEPGRHYHPNAFYGQDVRDGIICLNTRDEAESSLWVAPDDADLKTLYLEGNIPLCRIRFNEDGRFDPEWITYCIEYSGAAGNGG